MAVYDQSYTPWSGSYAPRPARIWAIVLPGLARPFKNIWILLVTILCFMIVGAWILILMVLATYAAQATEGSLDPKMLFAMGNRIYRQEFLGNFFFSMVLMILSVAAGSQLIANDLRHNALLMYFSRAVKRTDYVAGKYLSLSLFLLFVTLGPALLLFVAQIFIGVEDLTFVQWLTDLGSITLHSLILVLPMSAVVLACSSLTKRAYVAGILWSTLFFASTGFSEILTRTLEEDWCGLVSWTRLTSHLGEFCYEARPLQVGLLVQPPEPALVFGWLEPLIILGSITILSLGVVLWRTRSVEERE